MKWSVYILLCDKKSYYVGISPYLEKRIKSHMAKQNISTKEFLNTELVYHEQYKNHKDAAKRENQLKGWSFAKKKALIEGDIELLKKLSKKP